MCKCRQVDKQPSDGVTTNQQTPTHASDDIAVDLQCELHTVAVCCRQQVWLHLLSKIRLRAESSKAHGGSLGMANIA